jgi:hypothetical protein
MRALRDISLFSAVIGLATAVLLLSLSLSRFWTLREHHLGEQIEQDTRIINFAIGGLILLLIGLLSLTGFLLLGKKGK